MNQWKIEKSRLQCQKCEKEIEPGFLFWSQLTEGVAQEEQSLMREDFCDSCWSPNSPSFCFWKTTRKTEENLGPRMLDTDTLLTLFRDLNPDSGEPRKINFRYLLALILMRKKILREVKDPSTGILKLTDTVETWEVVIPNMGADDRHLAEEDIGQLIVGLSVEER